MIEHYITSNGKLKRIKDKQAAIIIAFGLGWFGMHKFYLEKPFLGILYLIFFPTVIPLVASIIEGILYLTMSDKEFDFKFNR